MLLFSKNRIAVIVILETEANWWHYNVKLKLEVKDWVSTVFNNLERRCTHITMTWLVRSSCSSRQIVSVELLEVHVSDDDKFKSSISSSVVTGYGMDNCVSIRGSHSGSGAVTVMVGIWSESRYFKIVLLFLVLASGGYVQGSGMKLSSLYFMFLVFTITNLCSSSLCAFRDCLRTLSFLE